MSVNLTASRRHASLLVLLQIAELSIGFSGAELASLLNEAAILAVSCQGARGGSAHGSCCSRRRTPCAVPNPCPLPMLPASRSCLCRLLASLTKLSFLPSFAPCPQVRQGTADGEGRPVIDLPILKEAMDKVRLGLPHEPLPDNAAKRQYATIEAARWVGGDGAGG